MSSNTVLSYFDRRKRDLSDKSNDGEERKKAKEGSLDTSTVETNEVDTSTNNEVFHDTAQKTFLDELEKVHQYLEKLDKKVSELYDIANTTKNSQIKGGEQLAEVKESINFINKKFDDYEVERKKKDEKIASLETNVKILTERLDKAEYILDKHEQYSRRNCLLLHGIPEQKDETTDEKVMKVFKEDMDIDITQGFFQALLFTTVFVR